MHSYQSEILSRLWQLSVSIIRSYHTTEIDSQIHVRTERDEANPGASPF